MSYAKSTAPGAKRVRAGIAHPIRRPALASARPAQPEKKSHKPTKAVKPAAAAKAPASQLEATVGAQICAAGLPWPQWGYKWHPVRRWLADAAWVERRLLLEVEGGVTPFRDKRTGELRQGRHVTITGYEDDCIKYSEAAICGWRVIRVTRRMVDDGRALALIERALAAVTAVQ